MEFAIEDKGLWPQLSSFDRPGNGSPSALTDMSNVMQNLSLLFPVSFMLSYVIKMG